MTVEPTGRVRSSTSPHGQGHDTTFAQIAADRLGIDPGDVVLRFGDSEVVRADRHVRQPLDPMGGSALVSRSTRSSRRRGDRGGGARRQPPRTSSATEASSWLGGDGS